MTDARALLEAFRADWETGRRPDVDAVLEMAPAIERGELADAIETLLFDAPVPRYDEETLACLESSQSVREAERAIEGRSGTWPLLLPALRRQQRLTRANVAKRLATDLGFPNAHRRVREHLHGMEYGTADPLRVSGRVLVALARLLGTTKSDLEAAGRATTLGGPIDRLAPIRRGFSEPPPFSEVPSGYRRPGSQPRGEQGAVDRLFLANGE